MTLGDPCGIGPELWVRVLGARLHASPRLAEGVELHLFGDSGVLDRAAVATGLAAEWRACRRALRLYEISALRPDESQPGQPNAASAAAQVAYLQAAIAAAESGKLQGLCTAPISKTSALSAGLGFPGHTELLGARLGRFAQQPAVMMLCGPSLRVALATTHLALAQVPERLTVSGLLEVICTTVLALREDFGISAPRLWVAALNPHAGEEGHFGDEEERIIRPALIAARARLLDRQLAAQIEGPLVPDALFRAAVHAPPGQRPDAVVAMYHDQGLIPLKLLDFDQAVNVTLGLRIVRTSPDHGVAYDIAGRGQARPSSQAAALALCIDLTRRRRAI